MAMKFGILLLLFPFFLGLTVGVKSLLSPTNPVSSVFPVHFSTATVSGGSVSLDDFETSLNAFFQHDSFKGSLGCGTYTTTAPAGTELHHRKLCAVSGEVEKEEREIFLGGLLRKLTEILKRYIRTFYSLILNETYEEKIRVFFSSLILPPFQSLASSITVRQKVQKSSDGLSLRSACHAEAESYCRGASNTLRCLLSAREDYQTSQIAHDFFAVGQRNPYTRPAFSETCENWFLGRDACLGFLQNRIGPENSSRSVLPCVRSQTARECLRLIPKSILPSECHTSEYYRATMKAALLQRER